MDRRQYLALVGSGTLHAGCLGTVGSKPATRTRQSVPKVELHPDPTPEDQPFSIESSLVQQFTRARPAKIRIQLTNESAEKQVFRFGPAIPFGELVATHEDSDSKLLLIPNDDRYLSGDTADFVPRSADGICWEIQQAYAAHDIEQVEEFDPDKSTSETYTVLSGSNDPCLESGRYRAEAENLATGVTWGFNLVVT